MRGVSGVDERKQHLVAWRVGVDIADKLRLLMDVFVVDRPEFQDLEDSLFEQVYTWSVTAAIDWVTVSEARPEVTLRRDDGAPMEYFAGKTVAVWGCGALGAHAALMLARAGVRRLVLRDKSIVTPGILVRQPFDDRDIGRPKVDCLKERIERIDSSIAVAAFCEDLINVPLSSTDWTDDVDIVIDASASLAVMERLELARKSGRRAPVVNMVIDGRAERALVTIARAEHSGGPSDISRRAKIVACGRPNLRGFADAFWPLKPPPVFQPEPGCSASTFRGSAADAMMLAASSLNIAAASLSRSSTRATASAHFVMQPHVPANPGAASIASLEWDSDRVHDDTDSGYQIRISPAAWAEMDAWVARSIRPRDKGHETGGVLFGQRNDASRVVWVDEVIGPPPDSRASAARFDCGVRGVAGAIAEKRNRTRDSVDYLGMWHTHPASPPVPSSTDRAGMDTLTSASGSSNSKALLVILRTDGGRATELGAYLFSQENRSSAV
jgi:integrative and conjugative element protein (TIGR02256 family)